MDTGGNKECNRRTDKQMWMELGKMSVTDKEMLHSLHLKHKKEIAKKGTMTKNIIIFLQFLDCHSNSKLITYMHTKILCEKLPIGGHPQTTKTEGREKGVFHVPTKSVTQADKASLNKLSMERKESKNTKIYPRRM